MITGSREFLMAMGAKDITKASRSPMETGTGGVELYSGIVPKETPICLESEKIMLTDEVGARTGQMTVYTTLAEIKAPAGYARSKLVAYEVYSDGTYYYPDGDMYSKVKAVRYEKNLIEDFEYQE